MRLSQLSISLPLLLLTPTLSFAFFCPNNFNQIQAGNTPDQVTSICGKPDKAVTQVQTNPVPQEWTYIIQQTLPPGNSLSSTPAGTMKVNVTFDAGGKVINISVNGVGVSTSTICGNTSINMGDTMDSVVNACGKPSFINKQDASLASGSPAKKVTTFTYGGKTLTFENDKLLGQ
jgi:hypothetical protein